MGSFREDARRFDLEEELRRAEEGAAAGAMRESVALIEPDVAFAEKLESRLRGMDRALLRAHAGTARPRTQPGGWRPGRVIGRPAARLSLVGVVLAVAVVGVFWLSIFAPVGISTPGVAREPSTPAALPTTVGDFVPQSKVRHIVITHTSHYEGSAESPTLDWTDEVWIANGSGHYIMRRITSLSAGSVRIAANIVVDDNWAWLYYPENYWNHGRGDKVYKIPYNIHFLDGFLPDKSYFDHLQSEPNVRVIGNETLDGVRVTRLESTGNALPHIWVDTPSPDQWSSIDLLNMSRDDVYLEHPLVLERASAAGWGTPTAQVTPVVRVDPGDASQPTIDYLLWMDGDYRVIQKEYIIKDPAQNQRANRISMVKLAVDELLDTKSVPADQFSQDFPQSSLITDAMVVFTGLGPQGVVGGQAKPSDWQVFNSPGGDFSLLMPIASPDLGLKEGWRSFEVAQDNVTYGVEYRDYDAVDSNASPGEWLTQRLADVETSLGGKVKSQKPIGLDAYPGLVVTVQRTDSKFVRAQVYLVGKRIYCVYAVAPDEQSAYSDALGLSRFLGSFKVLKP